MLRKSGLELDRIEPFAVLTQRRNRLLRLKMEQHAQAAVLQVQVDHGHAFFEAVMQRERDVAAQRSYANAPNQARNRINRRQPALLELAPSFAQLEQRTRDVVHCNRQKQKVVRSG